MKHRAKMKDVVQGRVLYKVYAFPESGSGHITELTPISRPYMNKHTKSPFFRIRVKSAWKVDHTYTTETSCMDAGIIQNGYNFHMTFTSRKAAEIYMNRVLNRNFTGNEFIKYARYLSMKDSFSDMIYDY